MYPNIVNTLDEMIKKNIRRQIKGVPDKRECFYLLEKRHDENTLRELYAVIWNSDDDYTHAYLIKASASISQEDIATVKGNIDIKHEEHVRVNEFVGKPLYDILTQANEIRKGL
jgi:hypothetical protein